MKLSYQPPEGWSFPTLADIASSAQGAIRIGPFGSSLKKHEYAASGIRVLGIEDVYPNALVSTNRKFIPESKYRELTQYTVKPGDLLVTNMGTVGRTCVVPTGLETSIISSHLIKVTLEESRAWPPYISWMLNSSPLVIAQIEAKWHGAVMAGFNTHLLKQLRIPLPPLGEQKRITRILDKVQSLRTMRREALTRLDSYLKAVLADLFGDPVTNPLGWPVRMLGEVTECLDSQRRPVKESERSVGTVPYYGANGLQGWIDRALFNEPLVLVAEDGGHFDSPDRGVAYRIEGLAWVNNHAHVLRPLGKHVDIEYLHQVLRHYDFTPYVSGTTRAKLTQRRMNRAPLPIPALELQRQFGRRVQQIRVLETALERSRVGFDSLIASLHDRAFRGLL